ncbi:anaerobic ribonucleoside-triphosphate reductase activating protein [Clostridiaceae bacterium M8S5]|nr:anaerobic ribonucleoside-triphosphate reductase activating protein [Clostridiaceae bacterium M8S5]
MIFSGHIKSSFIDYPDAISTVFFVKGCNFRCDYCHNSELLGDWDIEYDERYVFDYLNSRKKYIDAVCLSGGEITLYPEVLDFLKKVKQLGFLTKIDTNGTNPELIKKILSKKCLDYIAMDVKAPIHKYETIANKNIKIEDIINSIEIIKNSEVDYEFRTTVCRELLSEKDIIDIAEHIRGAKKYVLQNFRDSESVLIGKEKLNPYKDKELLSIKDKIKHHFNTLIIR